jgi:hypothetical protein
MKVLTYLIACSVSLISISSALPVNHYSREPQEEVSFYVDGSSPGTYGPG